MLSTAPAEADDELLPAKETGARTRDADAAASRTRVELADAPEGAPPANKVETLLPPEEADPYSCEDLELGRRVGRAAADAFDEVGAEAVGADGWKRLRVDISGDTEALTAAAGVGPPPLTKSADAFLACSVATTTDAKLGDEGPPYR
jgi:hypothetical protein